GRLRDRRLHDGPGAGRDGCRRRPDPGARPRARPRRRRDPRALTPQPGPPGHGRDPDGRPDAGRRGDAPDPPGGGCALRGPAASSGPGRRGSTGRTGDVRRSTAGESPPRPPQVLHVLIRLVYMTGAASGIPDPPVAPSVGTSAG